MIIKDIHTREIHTSNPNAYLLIDTFTDKDACLWPSKIWPRENFTSTLKIETIGSHGGTVYQLESYVPGEKIIFKFIHPKSYEGTHGFEIIQLEKNLIQVNHFLFLKLRGIHALIWRFMIQHVHNALIEDALDSAELFLNGKISKPSKWPMRVYFLRHIIGGSRLFIQLFGNFFSRIFHFFQRA